MKRLLLSLMAVGLMSCVAASFTMAQDLTADDYVELWQPFVGTWKGTIEVDGQSIPMTIRFGIAPNRKCLLIFDESEGVPGTQQLQVYDPVAKHEIAWGVNRDGQRQVQTIVTDGMKKGMKAAKGVGGSWGLRVFGNDGTTTTMACKWTIAQLDEKQAVIEWSDVKENGNPKPDFKMSVVRQPETKNSIFVIQPYKLSGMWVFDDERVGLNKEPFIAGADTLIDTAVKLKGIQNADKGFLMAFSEGPFLDADFQLEWVREESGGNVYKVQFKIEGRVREMEGWLCQALNLYYPDAPKKLYVQVREAK